MHEAQPAHTQCNCNRSANILMAKSMRSGLLQAEQRSLPHHGAVHRMRAWTCIAPVAAASTLIHSVLRPMHVNNASTLCACTTSGHAGGQACWGQCCAHARCLYVVQNKVPSNVMPIAQSQHACMCACNAMIVPRVRLYGHAPGMCACRQSAHHRSTTASQHGPPTPHWQHAARH